MEIHPNGACSAFAPIAPTAKAGSSLAATCAAADAYAYVYSYSPANLSPPPADEEVVEFPVCDGEARAAGSPPTFHSLAQPLGVGGSSLAVTPVDADGRPGRCSSTGTIGQVLAYASAQPSKEQWRAEYVTIISMVLQRFGRGALARATMRRKAAATHR